MKPSTIFSFFVYIASVGFEFGSLLCNSMVSIAGIKVGILTDIDNLEKNDVFNVADLEGCLRISVILSRYFIVASIITLVALFALHIIGCCVEHRYMRYIVCVVSLINCLFTSAILVIFVVSFKELFATKVSSFVNTLAKTNLNLVDLSTSFYLLCAAFVLNMISALLQTYNVPSKPNRYVNLI